MLHILRVTWTQRNIEGIQEGTGERHASPGQGNNLDPYP